jgi:hypothetical protein
MLISLTTLLATLSSIFRSRAALQLENLALRHQIGILQRCARKRPKLTPADRLLWVGLSRIWRGWRLALAIVQPETVIAWHRAGFRLFWNWKVRHVGDPRGAIFPAHIQAGIGLFVPDGKRVNDPLTKRRVLVGGEQNVRMHQHRRLPRDSAILGKNQINISEQKSLRFRVVGVGGVNRAVRRRAALFWIPMMKYADLHCSIVLFCRKFVLLHDVVLLHAFR